MKLIVGLGNPGKEYENTRHNVGFMVIDNYIQKKSAIFKEKFNGLYSEININGEKILLLKPLSFMNLSGIVVKKYINYFKIDIKDVLVVHDDMDFELGTYKIKPAGSSAGHNGIKSILENTGSENVKRIRIGISKKIENKVDYVVGNFSKTEKIKIEKVITKMENILDDFVELSFDELMSKYN